MRLCMMEKQPRLVRFAYMDALENSSFPQGLSDPDLVELYPLALARMVSDIEVMIELLGERDFQRACFAAYKLHGIASLFQMQDFTDALKKIIDHLESKSTLASVLLEDLAAKARLRLNQEGI